MTQLQTCSHWERMIAARHPQDLTLTERVSLNAHMATCASCAATALAYERMQQSIRALPPVQPLLVLSVPLGQQKRSLFAFRGILHGTQPSHLRMMPVFAPPPFRSRSRTAVATALVLVIIFVCIMAVLPSSRGIYIGASKKNQAPSPVSNSLHVTPVPSPTSVYSPGKPACLLDVNAGLHYVCQHKLYQTIAQKQVKGDFTVIVQAAYTDSIRLSVSYQILKKEKDGHFSQGLEGENSLDSGYVTLSTATGKSSPDTNLQEQGSSGVMDTATGKMFRVEYFNSPASIGMGGIGSIQRNVHLHFNGIAEYAQGGNTPLTTSAPFDFDFMVHMDIKMRMLYVQQTIVSKGVPMTLVSAQITDTAVVFHFNFQQPNATPVLVDLMAAGVRVDDGFYGNYDNVHQTMYVSYNGSLLSLNDPWTLKMQQRLNGSEG
ncbi:MAG TPA: hypothetical protein VFN23_05025, partial [Ktedonobacteraceae bacterium]|nr:hypothetical protein [Ktedonobacteraceae bacterium]